MNGVKGNKASQKRASRKNQPKAALGERRANAAGIDLGSRFQVVAVAKELVELGKHIREYESFVSSLKEMAKWFHEIGIETVAMESTGVEWIVVYELLEEEGFEVFLVDTRSTKRSLARKKSDVIDAEWLQLQHACGLLEGSFRPSGAICELRSYVRHRKNLIESAADEIRRMHKALSLMGLQLHRVIRDTTGKTGTAIIRSIVSGETSPEELAKHRDGRCEASVATFVKALQGNYRAEYVFELKQNLEVYDYLQAKIRECDDVLEQCLANFDDRSDGAELETARRRRRDTNEPDFDVCKYLFSMTGIDLTRVPGFGPHLLLQLTCETGIDLEKNFPTDKEFCSWVKTAPNNRKSAGKILTSRVPKAKHRVAVLFRLAARATRRSDSYIGAFYRRIAARKDATVANMATARKLAKLYYILLTRRTEYIELGADAYDKQYRDRAIRSLFKRATKLGFILQPTPATG